MKGVHHFIQCINSDEINRIGDEDVYEYDEELSYLCVNREGMPINVDRYGNNTFENPMTGEIEYIDEDAQYTSPHIDIINVMTHYPQGVDNFKIQIMAMACNLKNVQIFMLAEGDEEFFHENCVDTDAGEKA